MSAERISVQCCIAGGGPAGLMAGLLLARAGVSVLVLEKHQDFLRDFRGDTIHPSTLEVMDQLGLADALLKLPHAKLHELRFHIGDEEFPVAEFSALPSRFPFVAFMPQWDFLNFLASQAGRYPEFNLLMEVEATGLVETDGRVAGVQARSPTGELRIDADLVIAADGRHSRLRSQSGLALSEFGAPMDVLWFRLSRKEGDPDAAAIRIGSGLALVMIDRGDYWQCGLIIPKGTAEDAHAGGIGQLRDRVAAIAPFLAGRAGELQNWSDVSLLTVRVDRLVQWYRPGFLCIGDAAHAMSPIGGVGINLAIQDAVAAANLLAEPLREGRLDIEHLRNVQHRRFLPTRIIQEVQLLIQRRVLSPVLRNRGAPSLPLPLRLARHIRPIRQTIARVIGLGVRREAVAANATPAPRSTRRGRAQKKA